MSTAQLADQQHPWIGLSSFTEDDRAFFAGRGEEIDDLLRLVRRDTLTLLYGVSGLGKTSLLQAGLFPALRAEDYLPVPIRLDYMDGAAPITQQVLSAIAKASVAASVEAPAPLPGETLWEYFHRESNHFWSPRNDLVTPFLVFDQFEECFTLGRETAGRERRGAAFISELADLVENRPPAALRGDLQRAREFDLKPRPLKVLLAMREDYLAELDRIRSQFRALGQNRLRLLPMGERQARQVIDLGAPLLAPGVEDRIVTFAAGGVATGDGAEVAVAPALLSLVLQQLNERRLEHSADAKITAELLDMQQKKIFEDFYLRTLKPFDRGVGTFIEDRLLTASGFRNSCALDDALSCPGVTQPALDELVNSRLLAYEDRHRVRRVEITHDVLAPVIRASRDNRISREALARAERQKAEAREKERVARHRLLVMGSLLVLSVIGASFGLWQALLAKAETAKANKQTARAEELQEQMAEHFTQVELTAANDLKLEEEWATRLVHLDRALRYSGAVHYSQQNSAAAAKWANRLAKQHATATAALWAELRYGAASRAPLIRAFIDSKTKMIQYMVWSPKEPLLATAGFGDVLLWSFSGKESTDVSPQRCELTDPSTGDVTGLRFSADGKTLLVVRNKRWELISVAKKKLIFTSPPTELLLAGDPFSPDGMQVVTRPEGSAPHIIRTDIPDDPGAPVSISQIEIPIAPGVDLASPSSKGIVVAWSPKGDRIALADEKRLISVYSISKAGVTLLLPNAIEAFADVAPLRAAMNNAIEVKGLSFDESGDLLLVKDEKGTNPLFEIWTVNLTGAKRLDRASAKFRAWIPKRSVLLDIPIGDGRPVILNAPFKKGRALPIKDPSAPRFSTDGPAALFIQSKRNYQVLDLETGYPVTPPFSWWLGPITARLALSSGLIASVENKSELAFWDLRSEQRRWHADPPQPPPVAPVSGPHMKWKGSSSFSVGDLIDHLSLTKKLIARSDPVSQFVWEHVSAESRKALTDPASTSISAADLIDPSSLAEKLIASSGPVSQFVWEHFSPNSKKVLIDPTSVAEEKQGALVEELNKVLKGGPIYLDKRFEKVTLSSETLALKAKNPQGEDLALLNRLLLEDAYRPEFSRKKRDTLVEPLNKVLNAGPIYSDKRFENVTLSGETLALKAKNPQGEDLALLNRLLLEDAYSLEFRRNRWIADISVDQRVVVVAPSDDDWQLLVVISLDEQPTSVGWSADSRYLRIYSKVRGFIDLEWDPPTVMEEPIHKLVELLISRKDPNKAPAERFELRKEMPKWKAKDPRWQKLLDWWTAGRPDEVPSPNAQLLTDIPSDGAISSPPVGRDPESSVWVFHDSNTRPLTDADLRSLSVDDLWRARSEIFARRGAKIGGDRGRSLIKKLGPEFHDSGIKPDDAYDLMNGIEKANILLIKSIESQRLTGQ